MENILDIRTIEIDKQYKRLHLMLTGVSTATDISEVFVCCAAAHTGPKALRTFLVGRIFSFPAATIGPFFLLPVRYPLSFYRKKLLVRNCPIKISYIL